MKKGTEIKSKPAILECKGLPRYNEISSETIKQYLPKLINELEIKFSDLELLIKDKTNKKGNLDWETIQTPLFIISESLRWSWGVVSHLNAVCNSNDLRKVHTDLQPEIIRITNKIGQSKIIYEALTSIKKLGFKGLDKTQIRIIESQLLTMHQLGVGLEEKIKEQYNLDSEQIAKLATIFSNNVLDATNQWNYLITDPKDVDGVPQRVLEILAAAAKQAGKTNQTTLSEPTAKSGPWLLGLDMPRYIPFITYATNRSLREMIYKAYVQRASSGSLNNKPIIEEILSLREKQAKRLDYKNWAELSLASKMAKEISSVEQLLEELRSAAISKARNEISDIEAYAKKHSNSISLKIEPWDIAFWSEKLKKERFQLDQEFLRSWFPLPQVLDGLFNLCERLFDISIKAADGEAPVWNEDVRFFNVLDKDGSPLASFYLDPYSRPENKRGGAWMDECLIRSKTESGDLVLPVAYLICNQTPPVEAIPSLMSFEEVKTLFHEFGHGLQHMLTKVDYPQAAGINNVEWDAVELPSQFLENWCYDKKTLMRMALHWKTKEPLPIKEFEKLNSSKTYNSGLATLRQIHFALTDLALHHKWNKELNISPDEMRRNIAKSTTVIQPIPEDQFLCAFSHIFAGGYSAGYYSYKWAEVLSSDAFSAFEEVGLDQEEEIKRMGALFRETILSLGGSKSPSEIFEAFRGRPPQTNALIKYSGLNLNH